MGAFWSRWGMLALLAAIPACIAGCGGSSSNNYNPTPAATTIIPSNVTAGSQSFTMFVTGANFIEGAQGASFAYWNNSPRSTVFNTATQQLQVTIPASDVYHSGRG